MRYRQLGTDGPLLSELGFGASPLGGIYGGFAEKAGIEAVHAALDSLARLGVQHIDLIQCHDIEFGSLRQVASETIPALRALQDEGLVPGVGVTRYPLPALACVTARAQLDTVMSYCQYTLQDRRLAARVKEFAAAGAATINASPLAMGALTSQGAPLWHPALPVVLARCARAASACRVRGADIAKLALQFSVTTSPCVSTVVGSASPANVRRNVAWIEEPVDDDLLATVEAILAPVRDQGWVSGRAENQDPGGH